MNLSSFFPGLGGATAAPVTGVVGGYGFNWIIWIIIVLIIFWFGRFNCNPFGIAGYEYQNYGCGYPLSPRIGPFGGSWWWFIIIILVLVWLLGGINRI